MKLQQYLKNSNLSLLYEFLDIIYFIDQSSIISEDVIPDTLYNPFKKLGEKLGFKIKRTDNIFDYLSRAESSLTDLITYLTLYMLAIDKKQKEELKNDIKNQISKINKKELTNFFLLLDRGLFGFSSLLRNILMGIFGVEITTYKRWKNDIEFIEDKIKEIRVALMRTHPTQDSIDALNDFESIIKNTKKDINITEEITGCASGATTTDNVEKFWPKLGPTVKRRKKRKGLRNLL